MRGRWLLFWLAGTVVCAVPAACGAPTDVLGSDALAATCPPVVPCLGEDGGPNYAVPSYAAEIRPILQVVCVPCHGPGGTAGDPETTYADVAAQVESMLSFAGAMCTMPPLEGPQITTAQRIALEEWLSCGAPNN
jgi:mono/diheme cytochrome c family protein